MTIVKNRDGTATIHPAPYPHRREIWYDVWPTDYSNPPGDPDRYDEPVPDMIGSISDSYPEE
jgi:hypothetical protein